MEGKENTDSLSIEFEWVNFVREMYSSPEPKCCAAWKGEGRLLRRCLLSIGFGNIIHLGKRKKGVRVTANPKIFSCQTGPIRRKPSHFTSVCEGIYRSSGNEI